MAPLDCCIAPLEVGCMVAGSAGAGEGRQRGDGGKWLLNILIVVITDITHVIMIRIIMNIIVVFEGCGV
jgi:hypothetical protein